MTSLVTGGAGYVGAGVVDELLSLGRTVRVLDKIAFGQDDVAADLEARGVELVRGDIRDGDARRAALEGVDEVVHLAAIVGDPACARDPELAHEVNVEGSRAMVTDAAAAGVKRFVFASTCSNYGRMTDPTVPIDEDGELAPVSLYAEQKVGIEKMLLAGGHGSLKPTCVRLATVYGAAPRMRFDLTVNEFTRDLWADRELEVFGEQFWRPYVHVREAGRAIGMVLDAAEDVVGNDVFNVGRSDENYRKLDLVEAITSHLGRGKVSYVKRTEDPRDYKVSFEKIKGVLGFVPERTVPDGIAEIADALEAGTWEDPWDGRYRNIP